MANRHFAKLADVWKHLPLTEILSIERPGNYWETHAGNATYPMIDDVERAYGALRFVEVAPAFPGLAQSRYFAHLRSMNPAPGPLRSYPGSPMLGMLELAGAASYLFCDTDAGTVANLEAAGSQLGLGSRVRVVGTDGMTALHQALDRVEGPTLAHIDPYDPWGKGPSGLSALDLASELIGRGIGVVYWYGYDRPERRTWALDTLRQGASTTLWCGDVMIARRAAKERAAISASPPRPGPASASSAPTSRRRPSPPAVSSARNSCAPTRTACYPTALPALSTSRYVLPAVRVLLAQGDEGKAKVQASEVSRAVAAAMSTASALHLTVDDAIILQDSNKLALRLLPCDVLARVAHVAHQVAQFEVELAQRLAETESPVAALEPRVEPRVYERDGFVVTLWTYYEPVTPREVSPADYADALERLHAGMRKLDVTTPHFTDRVAEAQQLVASRDHTPALGNADRELLSNTLRRLRRAIGDLGAAEQLLHGEPHPGNVLSTKNGLVFIDLETCCRGPVEFDLAHVPEEVSERYPDADQELLRDCRGLVLAMVAAWRWDPGDRFPNGQRVGRELLGALRQSPPWPALDVVMRRLGGP